MDEFHKPHPADYPWRESKLLGEVAKVIEGSGCTYYEATVALQALLERYQHNGKGLLDETNIQEVAKWHSII